MRIFISIEILRPPNVVFPWVEDPNKAMKWQKDVKSYEIIDNRHEVVGTTFKEMIEEDGESLVIYGEIKKYIKNKLIEFHIESKFHIMDICYSVEPINSNNTNFSIELNINWMFPINIISSFIGNKMKIGIQSQMQEEAKELKYICENEK